MRFRGRRSADARAGDGAVVDREDVSVEQARTFFQHNATEVIDRMRHPSNPARNPAAVIVAKYAVDPQLRAEAARAVDDARAVREGRSALDKALESYERADSRSALDSKH
jgi:hypothetical protein